VVSPAELDAVETLDLLALDPDLDGRLTHRIVVPARPARHAEVSTPLHPDVIARLDARGALPLYRHQADAIDALRAGHDIVLATPTGSGKSLCYQVPIVESVVGGERDTALCVFPTKALAHDQLRSVRSWLVPGLRAVTYDGDTPDDERAWARKNANVVLTNPEMLHQGMLPYHARWATFLMRLRYVVIDELHALRGIFGSHVAHVLRRLRRVCDHYGANPTFCFASGTLGAPDELASALCGRPVRAVSDDGSPASERVVACWQRPWIDEAVGLRASANAETAMLLGRFVAGGHPTLAFTRSRRGAEVVARTARREVAAIEPAMAERVAAYRAGYLAQERRALEKGISDGSIVGVAATNALELGIDVGGLDAVVLNGFPGTLASFWQQAGRAGRTGRRSVAVLVAGDDQLDQWYLTHPDDLTTREPERAVVNPENPTVLDAHVACAAHELPLETDDERWFGPSLDDAVTRLVHDDLLAARAGRMFWAGGRPPARDVGLRSGTASEYELVEMPGERTVGTVDASRAFHVAFPGAIYLHQDRQYRVAALDTARQVAHIEAADELDEITYALSETDIQLDIEAEARALGAATVHHGTVVVTEHVVGYQRKRASTRELVETVALDLPPRTLHTTACWYTVALDDLLAAGIAPSELIGAVHAAEHALIGMLPRFAICDRWDVGGVSMVHHPATGVPTVFVYDGYPGGAGIADLAYECVERHVAATLELVSACPCEAGCPSCVQSPKCGNANEYLDKGAAVRWLSVVAAPA
jgi:DEAD/DEAH box helicase domain-containing protein